MINRHKLGISTSVLLWIAVVAVCLAISPRFRPPEPQMLLDPPRNWGKLR